MGRSKSQISFPGLSLGTISAASLIKLLEVSEVRFSKKLGLKIDAKNHDFLGGSDECGYQGLEARQGTFFYYLAKAR